MPQRNFLWGIFVSQLWVLRIVNNYKYDLTLYVILCNKLVSMDLPLGIK